MRERFRPRPVQILCEITCSSFYGVSEPSELSTWNRAAPFTLVSSSIHRLIKRCSLSTRDKSRAVTPDPFITSIIVRTAAFDYPLVFDAFRVFPRPHSQLFLFSVFSSIICQLSFSPLAFDARSSIVETRNRISLSRRTTVDH
jgi:hypothetical protein